VAKHTARSAKRANRANPREDRNYSRPRNGQRTTAYPPISEEFDTHSTNSVKKKVEILPRNVAQEEYVDVLFDPSKHIVFAMGPAGCGKTLLATLFAIKALKAGEIDKIIITRPAVSVDEQHGFLPGTLIEKMAPWVIPIMDVFKEHYSLPMIERMINDEQIEIAPLAYMRGRTLKNAIILFDEAQNATPNQMKMVLTRIGDNSRIIVTGDLRQHDRGFDDNGLKDFVHKLELRGSEAISVCRFDAGDVERHAVIEDVLRIYGEDE